MPDEPPIEGRVSALEQTAERHETRINAHGQEIDQMREMLIADHADNRHRDETMRRIEGKQDKLSGKMDALLLQPGEKWDAAKSTVVAVVITAVVTWLLSQVGI